jgi:hypothetical protein
MESNEKLYNFADIVMLLSSWYTILTSIFIRLAVPALSIFEEQNVQ